MGSVGVWEPGSWGRREDKEGRHSLGQGEAPPQGPHSLHEGEAPPQGLHSVH